MRTYSLKRVPKKINISYKDFVAILLLRRYIREEGKKVVPTAAGLDFGYMAKGLGGKARLTQKGLDRFAETLSY